MIMLEFPWKLIAIVLGFVLAKNRKHSNFYAYCMILIFLLEIYDFMANRYQPAIVTEIVENNLSILLETGYDPNKIICHTLSNINNDQNINIGDFTFVVKNGTNCDMMFLPISIDEITLINIIIHFIKISFEVYLSIKNYYALIYPGLLCLVFTKIIIVDKNDKEEEITTFSKFLLLSWFCWVITLVIGLVILSY